ncbi:hypothetical protein HanRHA438_Chr14g0649021 [Helianthus annuus]|nr:hypothetical protein HanRHA438_Chr14g0649021 [Helianthus annuus]
MAHRLLNTVRTDVAIGWSAWFVSFMITNLWFLNYDMFYFPFRCELEPCFMKF